VLVALAAGIRLYLGLESVLVHSSSFPVSRRIPGALTPIILPAHPLFPLVQVISSPQLLLNCSRLLLPDLLVGLLDAGCAFFAAGVLATGGSIQSIKGLLL